MRYSCSVICLLCSFLTSCSKFVEITPPRTQLVTADVFDDEESATAAVTGIYSSMMQANGIASVATTYYAGMSSDEMVDYSNLSANIQIYSNSINTTNTNILSLWGNAYQYIYAANAAIEGLQSSKQITPAVKKQLIAEAAFIRAFCLFYLINFYGDVPLVTSTSYEANATLPRSPVSSIYQQILVDLKMAQSNLSQNFSFTGGDRIRPVSMAATAMLARVYLYQGDWVDAEMQATSVIDNISLFGLISDPDSVFLANSRESIWQLQPVAPDYNTMEGFVFILTSNPSGNSFGVALNNQLISAFEAGDRRRVDWINQYTDVASGQTFYFPFKYKVKTGSDVIEYYTVLRLAEQYLIRAEARAHQNNSTGALTDLNVIRNRAGLANSSVTDQSSLFFAISQERRIELLAEWGHRWFDLKRTAESTAVLSPVKPDWQSTDTLYPIPASERQNNPGLTQNPGY